MTVTEDLDRLTEEVKDLSREIYLLKRRYIRLPEGLGKDQLNAEIRDKQFQALFYIEKIENLSKAGNKQV